MGDNKRNKDELSLIQSTNQTNIVKTSPQNKNSEQTKHYLQKSKKSWIRHND